MTKKEYLINEYDRFYENYLKNKLDFFEHPSTARIDPFKIADGLWYVGDKKVCIHLVETTEGLILIDSGYLGASHLLVDSIWRAGFDPRDIRIILHTHGHSDHLGASDEFKKMYGCKLAISRIDAELLRKSAKEGSVGSKYYPLAKMPEFDIELEDGETVELGNVKIKCVLTPGHTEGVFTLFFDATYEGKTYKVGLFGGAGVNALTLKYIYKKDLPKDSPEQMLRSIEMIRGIPVDIHLGNHPGNNKTLEKRQAQIENGGNPFIDENSWGDFLNSLEKRVRAIIEENNKLEEELDKICGQ